MRVLRTPSMRRVAAVAVFGAAAVAVRRYLAMRNALNVVPAELRSPVLAFVPSLHTRTLLLMRLNSRLRTLLGRGVTVTKRHVGVPAVRVLVATPAERETPVPTVLMLAQVCIHSDGRQ